uniref:Farnesyl pyrophosphate synthase n=1 Tax=Rhizophora mucronata TaxID=61149 RepID=A0A2P2LK28_RHIMU
MSEPNSKFLEVYSILKSELLQDPAFEFTDDSRQWIERVSLFFCCFLHVMCIFYLGCCYGWFHHKRLKKLVSFFENYIL